MDGGYPTGSSMAGVNPSLINIDDEKYSRQHHSLSTTLLVTQLHYFGERGFQVGFLEAKL